MDSSAGYMPRCSLELLEFGLTELRSRRSNYNLERFNCNVKNGIQVREVTVGIIILGLENNTLLTLGKRLYWYQKQYLQ